MTPMVQLSELARSLFSLWTLSLVLVGVFSIVRAAAQKRIRFAVLALFLFSCSYFLWQVLFDVHLFGNTNGTAAVSRILCRIPLLFWLIFLLMLTAAALVNLTAVIRYGKRRITPDAVKLCLDQIDCGVCCFRDDGMVLFSNGCMNRLCIAVTGERLLSGNQLAGAAGGVLTAEGRRWRFTGRDITLDRETLHELIAADVTAEYAKTEALQKDKEELSRLKGELKAYTLGIDETVRRQEILQAKVNIHDEMNRLMLSTLAAERDETEPKDRIFALWEQNALLLCMEADNSNKPKAASDIEKLAKALKIRLVWKNDLPETLSDKQRDLFYSAAKEAIANAAKHAGAEQIEISFAQTEKQMRCAFTNDGKLPTGEVRFAGGLYNLSALAQKQGASVSVTVGNSFTLTLVFPKDS
jgi:hypothetical protein